MSTIFSSSACFNIITVSGRKEGIDKFKCTLKDNKFHFDQTVASSGDKRRDWGTRTLHKSHIISLETKKVVLLCITESEPGLEWAKRCVSSYREDYLYISIKTAYYTPKTMKYGINITESMGTGNKEWIISLTDFKTPRKKHFDYFVEQFGFMDPKVKDVMS